MSGSVPPTLVLTAWLSSGITYVVSIVYMVLSIIGLIYYHRCETVDYDMPSADFFWNTVYRTYLQSAECSQTMTMPNLTQSYTVFVLVALTLTFSMLNLITAVVLTAMINNKNMTQYINMYVYAYIGCWVATLVVDLTLGAHLGMDITYISNQMNDAAAYAPLLEILRQGAFYLMAISLKGFVIHAIQLVLICLMIIYLYDFQDMSKKDEHSIHKVGAINAFDQPRRQDENWTSPDMYAMEPFPRGHLNNSYVDDNARLQQNDFYNNPRGPGSFKRSDSWNHQSPSSSSARPFSYLEEVRRPAPPPVKPAPAPAPALAWPASRSSPSAPWSAPAPRLPAPDYSPHSPRRLKSALKPNYM